MTHKASLQMLKPCNFKSSGWSRIVGGKILYLFQCWQIIVKHLTDNSATKFESFIVFDTHYQLQNAFFTPQIPYLVVN